MKRIKHLLSSLGFGARHESEGAQTDITTITEPEPSEPADTMTLVDRIRHELAASSVSVFSGRLSRIDVLVEVNGIQLGLTLSSAAQAEIRADTKIYSVTGSMSDLSEADLSECFSRLQQLLNADVANSALEKLQALISESRTLLHAEVDTSRCAQVVSVGTREPHVILGSYKVSADRDPSSTLWHLKLRLQTGDPTGRLRLDPIELESKRVRG